MLAKHFATETKLNWITWPEPSSEQYRRSDRDLSVKLVPTFADRGYRMVSTTDPYGRILEFLHRSRYFFFPSTSSIVLTRLSGPITRPTTSQNREESNSDLWICSQKLWPLDLRGGQIFATFILIWKNCSGRFTGAVQKLQSYDCVFRFWNWN
jgi:hypothetical protein